jgi:hypothetical protein
MRRSVRDQVLSDARLRAGLAKTGKGRDTWLLAGKKVTRAALIRILDERLALDVETRRARARYHMAVDAQRALVRKTHDVLARLVRYLQTASTAQELLPYGLKPLKKRRKATPEEMLLTVMKRRATRARNAAKKKR